MDDSQLTPVTEHPSDSPVANVPLFRPQALAQRQTQWMGTVLVTPRPSHRLFTVFAVVAAAAILALFFFGSYTKKAHLNGWLVPEQGMVRVFAPQAGVASRFFVKEGDVVRKGQSLVVLSTELKSASLGDTQANITKSLASRRESLMKEAQENKQLLEQQRTTLVNRLETLKLEQEQIAEEMALQRSRVALAVKSEARQRALVARGFISEQQLQTSAEARLEQAARLRTLQRTAINLRRERLTIEGDLNDLPIKVAAQNASIDRNIAALGQDLAEAEARREVIIAAPQGGIVTAIQSEMGGRASAAVPLLSIVPADATLEAHLFAPSRAIGFLKQGQHVLLRYSAYPYQKFGHYAGTVDSISRSALNPAELPSQLAGLTSLFGPTEPIYRIVVKLEKQTVTAYGNPVPLQPGMQLEAAVLIEERRLYEWVLDPLYTLSGKWRQ
jgi:membrane fusion protein